jgi:hypothetical protein
MQNARTVGRDSRLRGFGLLGELYPMGYELHITRAEFHADNAGHEITADEWLRCVQGDPELRLVPDQGKYFVQWSGPSEHSEPWFDWFKGCVSTKNPDRAILGKMLQIAQTLNARVQGDDGEFYEDPSEIPE